MYVLLQGQEGKTCNRRTGLDIEGYRIIVNIFNETFVIYNVPGQWTLRYLVPGNVKQSHGVLLLYNVANVLTFLELSKWIKDVREWNPQIIIFIIGVQCDLLIEKEVSCETGKKFARSQNLEFFECNIRTGENVNEVFEHMALRILQKEGLIPPDKIEIEGKSLEWKGTNEVPVTSVTEKELLNGCFTETEIINYKPKDISYLEDSNLQNGSKGESVLMKKDSTQSCPSTSKIKTSEFNENCDPPDNKNGVVQPKAVKSVISEEEMQQEGKCLEMINYKPKDTSYLEDSNLQNGSKGESVLMKKDSTQSCPSTSEIKTSELNENCDPPDNKNSVVLPKAEKSVISEEEMQQVGKCLEMINYRPKDTSYLEDSNLQNGSKGESVLMKKDSTQSCPSTSEIKTSEFNENCDPPDNKNGVVQPKAVKSVISEEEMQQEGKCPAWFA
nr:uncharacterized protein LOC107444102 isoform X2 [Parasteatoda tepidariorum]